ncbi:hypothetical protein CspeluHIS016_0100190 [Cutaneotrichosporon spelunceum]|uniref:Uncharacterized protein n=1 Tax=Cutaneotrichosporon spelunceum TaxID=1672016 RepID=A0AAD3TM74_9TREE|nr:hypothetical protein CspeluHIS016_0100190 [Cutaneotrichosporon spelunceum]
MSRNDLQPVYPPLTVFGNVRSAVTQLTIVDQMFRAGDSYTVLDSEGNVVVRAKAEEWSRKNKKTVYDGANQELGEIKDKSLSMHNAVEFTTVTGKKLLKASFHTGTDGKPMFRLKINDDLEIGVVGDWKLRAADIKTDKDTIIARAYHDNERVSSNEKWKGGDPAVPERQYKVDVAPGVDIGLMSVACILWDMIHMHVSK